ncbi:hypothetical protein G7A66_12045 [Altererythrobacter sp. SALINAS58]|uniref:DUF5681 domain-containing protein n=1 Tax=Alteripontixanthobacter muriae TaxID=2705546 RepID=UPI001574FFCA|nr:DUF5681 domain-containing protein [Alteripontixanthobacter muriae]NTZ43802.1 hypothetical protein [Alteripontixanthobacter muriae]
MSFTINVKKKSMSSQGSAKPRDENGRFRQGFSGNPAGRPRKRPEVPKHLFEQIGDALSAKTMVPGPNGKDVSASCYEAVVQALVGALPAAKPKELLSILAKMEELGVFAGMRQKAEPPAKSTVSEADLELLARLKKVCSEEQLAMFLKG